MVLDGEYIDLAFSGTTMVLYVIFDLAESQTSKTTIGVVSLYFTPAAPAAPSDSRYNQLRKGSASSL